MECPSVSTSEISGITDMYQHTYQLSFSILIRFCKICDLQSIISYKCDIVSDISNNADRGKEDTSDYFNLI
jgi:hypothetical protein